LGTGMKVELISLNDTFDWVNYEGIKIGDIGVITGLSSGGAIPAMFVKMTRTEETFYFPRAAFKPYTEPK
jgi:hypothetical protein